MEPEKVPWAALCQLEAQESWWCNSCPSLKTQRTRSADVQEQKSHTPAQTIRQSVHLPFFWLFILFQLSTDWMRPIHVGEDTSSLLSPPTQMLTSSRNTLTEIPRDNCTSLGPIKLIYKINHHTWNFSLSPAWWLGVRPCPGLELRVDDNFTGF